MDEYFESVFSLDGQTALVTGAGRGIGLALATALARAGANIVVLDMEEEAAKSAACFPRPAALSRALSAALKRSATPWNRAP